MRSSALLTLGSCSVLAGCEGAQSALAPRSEEAERLLELTWVLVIGSAAIFLLVMAMLFIGIARPRSVERIEQDPHRTRAVLFGVITTVVVLAALLVYSLSLSRFLTDDLEDPLRVKVTGRQFWWEIVYPGDPASETLRTANELHLPVGRPVEIRLTSHDVIHSLWIPNLQGKMDAIPGRMNILRIRPTAPGVYRGQCAEFCGLQHAKMALDVVVHPPEEFEAWRRRQLAPAQEPVDAVARRGRELFETRGCALCHAIRGTRALASAGPDLTHLASRQTIAAGTLPNRRGHLGGWILDPQSIKPGAHMPPNDLEPESLHAILDYLESLR